MSKKRRTFSKEFKAKVAMEALLGREIDLIRQLPFRNPYFNFKAQVEQSKVLIFNHAQRAKNLPI